MIDALLYAVQQSHRGEEITHIINIDKRLLTRPLTDNGQRHLLATALINATPEIVQLIITTLGDQFKTLPEMKADHGIGFYRQAARHLGAPGARIVANALNWKAGDIQKEFEFALIKNDVRLTAIALDLGANIERPDCIGSSNRLQIAKSYQLAFYY